MKIEYIFQHRKDNDIQEQTFTIQEVENGDAKTYIGSMIKDGYGLVARYVQDE